MTITSWWKRKFSKPVDAMALYKKGMRLARDRDHDAAIAAYSSVIDMATASDEVKAMALYNRAIVLAATRNAVNAVEDLTLLLKMPRAKSSIKAAAKQKLEKIKRRNRMG